MAELMQKNKEGESTQNLSGTNLSRQMIRPPPIKGFDQLIQTAGPLRKTVGASMKQTGGESVVKTTMK